MQNPRIEGYILILYFMVLSVTYIAVKALLIGISKKAELFILI
jgi:hypothetical protein